MQTKNPNMKNVVVRKILEDNGVKVTEFQPFCNGKQRVRKSKLKFGNTRVSMPVPRPVTAIKEDLQRRMSTGEILSPEMIVPKEYRRFVPDDHGTFKIKHFSIYGQKLKLFDIRKKLLEEQIELKLLRFRKDEDYDFLTIDYIKSQLTLYKESFSLDASLTDLRYHLQRVERTRHLKNWFDCSCILNHGSMLGMVGTIYDPAVYYTPDEYFALNDEHIDVQEYVERPHFYMFARTPDSIEDQLLYSDSRRQDLVDLDKRVVINGVQFKDIMRLFNGDHPAAQLEAGQSMGGSLPCVGCKSQRANFTDIAGCFRADFYSYNDRQEMVSVLHIQFSLTSVDSVSILQIW